MSIRQQSPIDAPRHTLEHEIECRVQVAHGRSHDPARQRLTMEPPYFGGRQVRELDRSEAREDVVPHVRVVPVSRDGPNVRALIFEPVEGVRLDGPGRRDRQPVRHFVGLEPSDFSVRLGEGEAVAATGNWQLARHDADDGPQCAADQAHRCTHDLPVQVDQPAS